MPKGIQAPCITVVGKLYNTSFGFAFGDVFATIQFLERVATEVRNHRDAPLHFQQLGAELHLLQRPLQKLLHMEPNDEDERGQLEQIRAIALHCRQPVQALIDRMRPSGISLGHVSSLGTLKTMSRRLHWSLITRGDVDELRKVIGSDVAIIKIHLGMLHQLVLQDLRREDPAPKNL